MQVPIDTLEGLKHHTFSNEKGCWIWNGTLHHTGYGVITVKEKQWQVHRYAFFLANGAFDKAMLVCHKCDNPRCINPEHLFLGNNLDNIKDSINKGRFCKLNPEKVNEIREALARGVTGKRLTQKYNVSKGLISMIKNNKIWSELAPLNQVKGNQE